MPDPDIGAQAVQIHSRFNAAADKRVAQIGRRNGPVHALPAANGGQQVLYAVKRRRAFAAAHEESLFAFAVKPAVPPQIPAHMRRHGERARSVAGQQRRSAVLHFAKRMADKHRTVFKIDVTDAQRRRLRQRQPHVQAQIGRHSARLHLRGQPLFNLFTLLFRQHGPVSLLPLQRSGFLYIFNGAPHLSQQPFPAPNRKEHLPAILVHAQHLSVKIRKRAAHKADLRTLADHPGYFD